MQGHDAGQFGATITLHLVDDESSSIRSIEKDNWSGIGVDCWRKDLARACGLFRDEFATTGVYVLSHFDGQGEDPHIYVGESDNLGARLSRHANREHLGWQRLAIFTSNRFNKAHARYLEARLCQLAKSANRSVLENRTLPKIPNLSPGDKNYAEGFLREMRIVLPVVGVSEFEPPAPTTTPTESVESPAPTTTPTESVESPVPTTIPTESEFELVDRKYAGHAYGVKVQGAGKSFKVFEGATGSVREQSPYPGDATKRKRKELQEDGTLVPRGDGLRLTKDHVFTSSSSAASVLAGSKVNGPTAWRRQSDGRTLREVHGD